MLKPVSAKLIFIVILLAPQLLAQETKPQKTTANISGTVVKAGTGEPVKKAQITLTPSVFNVQGDAARQQVLAPKTTVTDATGAFEFVDVAPGEYYLNAVRAGYRRPTDQEYGSGQMIIVRAGEDVAKVVLQVSPAAAIRGRVLDEDGEPMSNVNVVVLRYAYALRAKRLAEVGSAETDDRGEYRIGELRPGRYYVFASPGSAVAPKGMRYVPSYYPDTHSLEGAAEIQLRPGDEGEASFHLIPAKTVSVTGTVVGPADKNYIAVFLAPKDNRGVSGPSEGMANHAQVGENGEFTINSVLPGTYIVSAHAYVAPQKSKSGKQEEPRILSAQEEIRVSEVDVAGIHLTLSDSSSQVAEISGQMTFKTPPQASPEHLSVYAQPARSEESDAYSSPGDSSQISKTGTFTLKLRSGFPYFSLLTTSDREFQPYYTKAIIFDGRDVTGTGFTPGPGKSKLEIIVDKDGALIEGTVVDSSGRPFPGAKVIAVPEDQYRDWYEDYGRAQADQNGHFSLPGQRPGEYRLYAWDVVEEGAYMDPAFTRNFDQKSVTVKAASNGRYEIKLEVIRESSSD